MIKNLELKGWIVYSSYLFHHGSDKDLFDKMGEEDTKTYTDQLIEMHEQRIQLSDAIYVINKNGYIGENTKHEIEYAKAFGKEILYMENPGQM